MNVAVLSEVLQEPLPTPLPKYPPLKCAPSTNTSRKLTPTSSEAVPPIGIVPFTIDALVGVVIATVGGVVSGTWLPTATLTKEVDVLPAASVTWAVIVCSPLINDFVSRPKVQVVVPEAPTKGPVSTETWTTATPAAEAAVPVTLTIPEIVVALMGKV